jgi:hypothetical protein
MDQTSILLCLDAKCLWAKAIYRHYIAPIAEKVATFSMVRKCVRGTSYSSLIDRADNNQERQKRHEADTVILTALPKQVFFRSDTPIKVCTPSRFEVITCLASAAFSFDLESFKRHPRRNTL